MRLVAFDLDDTLMTCGHDYGESKDSFGSFMADAHGIDADHAIETLDDFDNKNVDKFGLSMERFPQSFVNAYDHLVADPCDDEREHVRDLGYAVFKTTEEYAARGFMEGAETLLQALNDHGFDMHIITAGDERVQQRKIDGLGLDQYFDETHITPINGKAECLSMLMDEHGYTPDETFLIGNSLTSDIKAALDADARGIYIPTHEWRPTEDREYYETHERVNIFESLTDLANNCPDILLQDPPEVSA